MPYECYCIECGLFFYAWTRSGVLSQFWEHVKRSHPHKSRYRVQQISSQRYWMHQRLKDDPRYWNALRNSAKVIA